MKAVKKEKNIFFLPKEFFKNVSKTMSVKHNIVTIPILVIIIKYVYPEYAISLNVLPCNIDIRDAQYIGHIGIGRYHF